MAEALPPPYSPPQPQPAQMSTNPYHAGYDQAVDSQPKYEHPQGPRQYPPGQYTPMGTYPPPQQPAVSTTQVNVTQVSPSPVVVGVTRRDYTCSAIWVCLCCFWPTGIAAIYYASKAQDEYSMGNFAEAEASQRKARMFIILSIVLGVVVGVAAGIIIGLMRSQTEYRYYNY